MRKDPAICFQTTKPAVNTRQLFDLIAEGDLLCVKNAHINVLYAGLTVERFDEAYNFLNQYLYLDFSPLLVEDKAVCLTSLEQAYLEQVAITHSLYFYTVNGVNIKLKLDKIDLAAPLDEVISLLDLKYGVNTPISLALGAHLLRRPLAEYRSTVQYRRQYYAK